MGSSVAPKSFPMPGGFGQSQTNSVSQVQAPAVAVNPQQSQGGGLQNQQPLDTPQTPATPNDPNALPGGAGLNTLDQLDILRRIRGNSDRPGAMPFYG